jgi:hypothetical protein
MAVTGRGALWGAVAVFCFFACVLPASAAELPPYELNPDLSLTGDCTTTPLDPVPDPSCPYPPPPGGPSGRFDEPRSVAVDAYGNVYVAVFANGEAKGRIDVFDDEGKFVTEVPDPRGPKSLAVDSKGNLYVFEGTSIVRYVPTVYEPEAGKIGYGHAPVEVVPAHFLNRGIAVDLSNDHLYVARLETIAEYSSAAAGNKLLDTITHPPPANWSTWVAVDSERRRLYASVCRHVSDPFDCVVRVFEADAPHKLLKEVEGPNPPAEKFGSIAGKTSIAVDEETGDFFVEDIEESDTVYQFNKDYELVSEIKNSAFQGGNPLQIAVSNSPLNEDAVNHRFLFVPVLPAGNRVLAFEPPGILPPEVDEASVLNIGENEAEIQATVDPNGGDTEYVVEYVTQQAFEEEGFLSALVAGEGTIPGASLPTRVSVPIEGLSPGVAYRVRVLAENEVGEAEPITERVFSTYLDVPVSAGPCPNDSFRIGFSAALPDCRAYELVTPPDTNGRPVRGASFAGDQFSRELSSPAGDVVSFLIEGGVLPGMEGVGGLEGDPYKATRGPSGWTTTSNGPRGSEASVIQPGGVSSDQAFSFWRGRGAGSAVVEGKETHFIRYPDGHSELIGVGSLGTDPGAVGRFITQGGTHIIFQTRILTPEVPQQLEPNAPPTGTEAVYDRAGNGVTHVVSLLPGNVAPVAGQHATYLGASADGSGIAFEIGDTLYLRKDNAVTFEIGESVEFAGVSGDGERIFYVEEGDLYAFDAGTEGTIAFTSVGNVTPVNIALDGTRAYFVTTSVIPGGGQNPNGAFAKAGQQNLYLSEEGNATFVATVTPRDVQGEAVNGVQLDGLGLWTRALDQPLSEVVDQLVRDPSRLTPDGAVMLFQSRAILDGYDSGNFAQIYRYDRTADRLECISCIPTGVPANGGASLQTPTVVQSLRTDAPSSLFGFVPNLRADGKRAFFESEEALVSTDTNGAKDVYEWEEQGVGSCERASGCVYLISSGRGAQNSYLFGHSDSGDDVFFTTNDVLTGFDLGATTSVYDARVGGGFPEPAKEICVAEGCRTEPPPPPAVIPAGKAGPGDGNFKPRRKSRACPKGKRKVKRNGKVRCVKKHRKHQRKAGSRRGTAR